MIVILYMNNFINIYQFLLSNCTGPILTSKSCLLSFVHRELYIPHFSKRELELGGKKTFDWRHKRGLFEGWNTLHRMIKIDGSSSFSYLNIWYTMLTCIYSQVLVENRSFLTCIYSKVLVGNRSFLNVLMVCHKNP